MLKFVRKDRSSIALWKGGVFEESLICTALIKRVQSYMASKCQSRGWKQTQNILKKILLETQMQKYDVALMMRVYWKLDYMRLSEDQKQLMMFSLKINVTDLEVYSQRLGMMMSNSGKHRVLASLKKTLLIMDLLS